VDWRAWIEEDDLGVVDIAAMYYSSLASCIRVYIITKRGQPTTQ
jgi:hypothetical protein